MQYRKRPVVIDAVQWLGTTDSFREVCAWAPNMDLKTGYNMTSRTLSIITLEGTMTAQCNDWIIRGIKGEYYPCKPDIFEATYTLATTGKAALQIVDELRTSGPTHLTGVADEAADMIERLVDALDRLLWLHDYKDRCGETAAYLEQQPRAWDAARGVLE